ncbi:MAG: LPS assembly protein LptD [Pseudomonadota bacterium]
MVMTLLLPLVAGAASNAPGLYLEPDKEAPPLDRIRIGGQDKDAPVTVDADEMGMDQQNGVVVATGNVEVMQGESILTADTLIYYQKTDIVVAQGNVSMLQPSGDVYFADRAELKDQMKKGIIHNFKARMADNSVLVAKSAVKVNSSVTALKKASYTPCNLCENMAPFWQMNAGSAVVDDISERVTYRDATIEMMGYPVLYTPYMSHPTPDATGKSGFLAPIYSTNVYFGATVKAPYYWRIDEDKDATITPWMTAEEGPLLQWDYNQLRNHGDMRVRGSFSFPEKIDNTGATVGGSELRGHIFAQGTEMIDDDVQVGLDIQRATDDTYLRRYGFSDQQSLFSRAYIEQAQGRNFALAQGLSIQGLRATDSGKTTPLVLPILQGYYETAPDAYGITYHIAGDAQSLTRQSGVDQRRLSVTPGLTLPYVSDGGQVFTTTLNLRQDLYNADNVPITTGGGTFSGTTARTLPQAALEWRYPLINQFEQGSWVVEPVVLGVAQTNEGNPQEISNEDSKLLELSDTNLFSIERMPGLDLVDSGSRVAYGVRSQYFAPSGVTLDGLLGQNYSFTSDTPFPNSTVQGERFSDYIGRVGLAYAPLSLSYRFALNKANAAFNRNEVGLGFSKPWLTFYTSYRAITNNQYLNDSQEGIVSATLPVSDEWSIYGGARRDLELNQMVTTNGGIMYKNECFNLMLDALRVYAADRDIQPTTSVTFRVGFKNLGEFGGK